MYYATEVRLVTFFKLYCKKVCKWTWSVIYFFASSFRVSTSNTWFYTPSNWFVCILNLCTVYICWQEKFGGLQRGIYFFDETDCRKLEPSSFNPSLYSDNFNGPGLRYEMSLCKYNGRTFRASGPYPCGTTGFLIFCDILRDQLEPYEKVFTDRGHADFKEVIPYTGINDKPFHGRVRA